MDRAKKIMRGTNTVVKDSAPKAASEYNLSRNSVVEAQTVSRMKPGGFFGGSYRTCFGSLMFVYILIFRGKISFVR